MKYLIILALGVGLTLSCSKAKTPTSIPLDNTDTTETKPPVDTTDDNPSNTTGSPTDTTTSNNDVITVVAGVSGYISTNKEMGIVILGMSNAWGQVFGFDSRYGSELQMTFRSKDHNPKIAKQTTTSFWITYADSYKGYRPDTLTANDTLKYCGWIVEGVDRKKYGCDRLYLINTAAEQWNSPNIFNVNDLLPGEDTLITDAFYRKVGAKMKIGILNLKY